ncbi:MAG: hypothetical protein ACIWVG_31605, partial [Gloeotrichia echinulata HAB0833]
MLIVFSALSAISIAVIAVFIWQIQKNLGASTSAQENLIQIVEVVNQLSKQLNQINTELDTQQTKYSELLNTKVQSLIQGTANLENRFTQLAEVQNKAQESITNLVQGKTEIQLEQLQTVAEKLDGFVTVQNQVQSLIQGSANLEERLTQLVEVQNQAQESIANLV